METGLNVSETPFRSGNMLRRWREVHGRTSNWTVGGLGVHDVYGDVVDRWLKYTVNM
jgi:hypothetical protein